MSMMRRLSRVVALPLALAGCIGGGDVSGVEPLGDPGTHFPRVTGTNLHGDVVTLPDALRAPRTLLAIGFEDRHKHPLNDWIDRLPDIEAADQALDFFEVPVIYELKPWSRVFLNNAMRVGVTGTDARARTVTVYLDRSAFQKALDLPTLGDIYLMIVDPGGRVLWRRQGPVSDQAVVDLVTFLKGVPEGS